MELLIFFCGKIVNILMWKYIKNIRNEVENKDKNLYIFGGKIFKYWKIIIKS